MCKVCNSPFRAVVDDPRRRGAVFNNECFIETFVEREKKEALSLRNYRGTDAKKMHEG